MTTYNDNTKTLSKGDIFKWLYSLLILIIMSFLLTVNRKLMKCLVSKVITSKFFISTVAVSRSSTSPALLKNVRLGLKNLSVTDAAT
jgi:hypothetical protein